MGYIVDCLDSPGNPGLGAIMILKCVMRKPVRPSKWSSG